MKHLFKTIRQLKKTLELLKEIQKSEDEDKESVLELEDHNFRVNSDGWKKYYDDYSKIEYLENKKKDIWEINSGELKGEQLFTWDSAIRETKKVGKRIPTDKEFTESLENKSDMTNLMLAGGRDTDGSFANLGAYAYFWSSSQGGTSAWIRLLGSSYASVSRYLSSKAYGFSVRCLKN